MASALPLCDLCLPMNSTRGAEFWCFLCNESLCSKCERKHQIQNATNSHKSITIDEYQKLPSFITSIKQVCSKHNKRVEIYCKDHDVPCCLNCLTSDHKRCDETKPLEDIVRNVKESALIEDLESRIDDIPIQAKQLLRDLATEKDRVNIETKRCIDIVKNVRKQIDQHLDRMQAKLQEKIITSRDDQLNQIDQRIDGYKTIQDAAKKVGSDLKKMIKNASNLHVYLAMNPMEIEIMQCEDQVRAMQEKNNKSFDSLKLQITSELLRLTKNVDYFGTIEMKYRESPMYHPRKEQQGQTLISNPVVKLIKTASFVIEEGVKAAKLPGITGYYMTDAGKLVVANCANKQLLRTSHGKIIGVYQLPFEPWDVKQVDNSTLAITSSIDGKLVLMDNQRKFRTVYEGERCFGMFYKDETFMVSTGVGKKILIINTLGNVMSTINTNSSVLDCCFQNGKLYYTESMTDTVFCCDSRGKVIWIHICDYGDRPSGIAVDQLGNTFVACAGKNKVILISRAGTMAQIVKVVLSSDNGLHEPRNLYFNEKNNSLLVSDRKGSCNLYACVKYTGIF